MQYKTYLKFLESQFCQSRKCQGNKILWDLDGFSQHLHLALGVYFTYDIKVASTCFTRVGSLVTSTHVILHYARDLKCGKTKTKMAAVGLLVFCPV